MSSTVADAVQPDTSPTVDRADPLRRRQYANPPVIEGIARFQWAEPLPWSFTTAGLLFERLRSEYPGEPRAQAQVSAEVVTDSNSVLPNTGFELRKGPERIIYSSEDGARRVAVSPADLSVHSLPPYEGWESVIARLRAAMDQTRPVLSAQGAVRLVGLRYVNRVELAAESVNFDDYLTVSLGFPPGFPTAISGFLDRVEMVYEGEPVMLAFTWASTDAPPGTMAFILDLDLYATCDPPVEVDRAFEILNDLKVKEGRAFEALLKDRLREEFGEIS